MVSIINIQLYSQGLKLVNQFLTPTELLAHKSLKKPSTSVRYHTYSLHSIFSFSGFGSKIHQKKQLRTCNLAFYTHVLNSDPSVSKGNERQHGDTIYCFTCHAYNDEMKNAEHILLYWNTCRV